MPGEMILILEDDPRNLELVRDVLEYHGFQTLEATDATSGLQRARANRPDLVLTDIQLPGMDGVQVLRSLRSDPTTAHIPVVALTAFAMPEDRERFLDAGFDGYIAKPIEIKALAHQVRAFCRLRAAAADS